jgi:exosortase/archaeosortase family protein
MGANVLRLTATAIMARYIDPEAADGFLHDFSGIIVFMVAFFLLSAIYFGLSKLEKR